MAKTIKGPDEVQAAPVPAGLPEHALRDEFAGQGGSYTYDPASGKRVPAEQPVEQPAEGQVSDE